MSDIAELIARLEAATGGRFVLDCEIWLVIHPDDGVVVLHNPLPYTSSIDAALTLVPEGMAWTLGQNVHHRYWQACVNDLAADGSPVARGESGHRDSKSPALALCIAALKSRTPQP